MAALDPGAFREALFDIFEKNHLSAFLDSEKAERFRMLTEFLLEQNARFNLTAVTDPAAVILRHYADSVSLCPLLPSGTLLDVGCGAGFPSLPIALCRPDIRVTALDATRKRTEYVQACADRLGLSGLTVLCGRAEELAHGELRASFTAVTARGVAELRILAELCIPFLQKDGLFLAMKATGADAEAAGAETAVAVLGARPCGRKDFSLTDGCETLTRSVLLFRKDTPTPALYPRPYAKILKKPLGIHT